MEYKVIFHIDEQAKWDMLLGNVENLLKAWDGGTLTIEVLANAEAVLKYTLTPQGSAQQRMKALHARGVAFAACMNAMKANGVNQTDIMDFIEPVPAGVVELVRKQAQGYAYIKP